MIETKLHTQNAILQPHTQTDALRAPTHRFLTKKRKKKSLCRTCNDYDVYINFEWMYVDYLGTI